MESENHFQQRLDEVNLELAGQLKREEEKRYELLQTSKSLGRFSHAAVRGATVGGAAGGGVDTFTNPYVMTNSDHVAREISVAVAREMKCYEGRVQEAVEREWEIRLQGLDQQLRGRFTEMQTMHERMTQVLLDTSKGLEKHKKVSSIQQDKLEQRVDDALDDFRKDLRASLQEVHREVRSLKDQVNEGQIDQRGDAKEINRRIDDTQRRIAGIQHEVELGVDTKLVAIRQEVLDRTKADMRRQEDDLEKLRRELMQAQGTMEQATAKVAKLAEELDESSDQVITHGSQLRTLTGDLAQLELLTKRRLDKSLGIQASSGGGGGGGDEKRLQQDVFSLKQSVAYLASVLEANGLINKQRGDEIGQDTSNEEFELSEE